MQLILHSDLNCFYASVEMTENPRLLGKRVAVCGSKEDRHGIVLTASYPAKRAGVKTGMTIADAKTACPGLICVPPHYTLYGEYSRKVREIYREYSDTIEPYGMDENWILIPYAKSEETTGVEIANDIRDQVKLRTGLTVSVGVSFNKVFAKLGSDMKKPDAVTVISRENFREKVWPLPASDLLWVGHRTAASLARINIRTIGDLAARDPELLRVRYGKIGLMLSRFARGEDRSPVMPADWAAPIKSIGHGTTARHDLTEDGEIRLTLLELAQDVTHRLLESRLCACGVELTVRDCHLCFSQYHGNLTSPTQDPGEIAEAAFALFCENWNWCEAVRALTVRAVKLQPEETPVQTDFFSDPEKGIRQGKMLRAVDAVRKRFGERAIVSASLLGGTANAQDGCELVHIPGRMYGI